MAGELSSNTGDAAIAYKDALNQAEAAKNMLFRQYGFVAPGVNGYSTENAQSAFSTDKLLTTDKGLDVGKAEEMGRSLSIGGTGRLADVARAGTTGEANVTTGMSRRGFVGDVSSGLTAQERSVAETEGVKALGTEKQTFLTSLGQAYAPIGQAYQTAKTTQAQNDLARTIAEAIIGSTTTTGKKKGGKKNGR